MKTSSQNPSKYTSEWKAALSSIMFDEIQEEEIDDTSMCADFIRHVKSLV